MENSAEIVGGPPKDRNCKFCTSASAANLAVDSYVYFPIQGISVESFKKEFPLSPRRSSGRTPTVQSSIHGKRIDINNKEIALFCYRDNFYAVDDKCPHMGGPLHLGDIEDMYPGCNVPCIVCPWHKWTFDLKTGNQKRPDGKYNRIQVYPVKTSKSGQLSIGFTSIDPSYFNLQSMDF